MSFTQPICDDCWDEKNPTRLSPRQGSGKQETCCNCGNATQSGIYIRIDPKTVKFPQD